ncbi:protein of unknown function [Denitratisoma oestradiolicum]|uniref:Uncharacterized protein n=1 Tax=Denitratisoma oestradiolicum TaxID=311182 RepID=A0A6S6Y2M0_9PROT|nr:protein of unknown function [Denitratisoma oestradiolicum]
MKFVCGSFCRIPHCSNNCGYNIFVTSLKRCPFT